MKLTEMTAGNRPVFILIYCLILTSSRVWANEPSNQCNPQTFVNSLGMQLISIKGRSFDAWTPSMAGDYKMSTADQQPDVAYGQNRPHVPIWVELKDYSLAEFPVTNGMYRQFVEEVDRKPPHGEAISLY